jgi:hypothetical protein
MGGIPTHRQTLTGLPLRIDHPWSLTNRIDKHAVKVTRCPEPCFCRRDKALAEACLKQTDRVSDRSFHQSEINRLPTHIIIRFLP